MKRLTATVIGAFAFLIFAVSPAHALKAIVATIALGKVQVIGIQAQKNATIKWEDNEVTHSNKLGAFLFSTTILPIDCVGELSDGVSTIRVVVFGCTTQGGVLKTGQTTCWDPTDTVSPIATVPCASTGQDGDFLAGTPVPSPRFTDNSDGTVTDNLTGLIWLKDASCLGVQTWANALAAANTLADGNVACVLSDSSVAGDWRLPNRNELTSLFDLGKYSPALPSGYPFTNFPAVNAFYWSSTTHAFDSAFAWVVVFDDGAVDSVGKNEVFLVLAVRGGS